MRLETLSVDVAARPAATEERGLRLVARGRASTPVAHVMQVVISLRPGGTEHLVMEICRRLGGTFRSTVCCLDEEGAWAPQLRAEGIDVIALGRRPGFRPEIGRQIARLADARGADLLHCHQYSPFVYGRIAACFRRRLKLVYTEHGRLSDAPPSWKRRLANPLLARFDGPIVAVSDELRGYLEASRFPRGRVQVVHNGIEVGPPPSPADRRRARQALGLGDDAFVVATVARLDAVKNLPCLLDAFAAARRAVPGSRLLIVGDGPERAALAERAARPDLSGHVSLLGMRSDVRALMPAADLFVNSSISEGMSITILEAMAAAVPVVATAVGGNPEVLGGGAAGVLVPTRDVGRLAAAIVSLAEDPGRRAALAVSGRRRLETMFTIQRMVGEYARLYTALMDGR